MGFDSSFGVDHLSGKSVAPMIVLDLQTEQGQKHLWEVLSEPGVVFVHLAPPCGTSSRARLRQWKGAPPILRTDKSPDGVPNLSPGLQTCVEKANLLYKLCTVICRFCHSQGILYSCENPFNSFMWKAEHFRLFLKEVPHFQTALHHGMFGSRRQKKTLLVRNSVGLLSLAVLCDGQHDHDKWGMVENKFATSLETAYPWRLCQAIADAIQQQLQSAGVVFPPLQLKDLDNVIQASRAFAGVQTRRKLPPLVPEFHHCVTVEGLIPQPPAGFTPGQKTGVDFHVPRNCSTQPPTNFIPAGSKILRAQFVQGESVSSGCLGAQGPFESHNHSEGHAPPCTSPQPLGGLGPGLDPQGRPAPGDIFAGCLPKP